MSIADDPRRSQKTRFVLSTAQILSLLTAGVVLSVLTIAIAFTWMTLTRSALGAAQDRLNRGARQLATVAATGIRTAQARYAGIAHDSSVRRAVSAKAPRATSATDKSVLDVLAKLQTPTDSGMPVELWDAAGRRVAYVGDDLPVSPSLHVGAEDPSRPPAFRPGLDSVVGRDSLQLGQLYSAGGRTLFWIAMPVVDSGRAIGYILQQRRIAANPNTEQTLRDLSGDSVTGYYRNVDGTVWTTFGGTPVDRPPTLAADHGERVTPGVGRVLFAERRVDGTPLVFVMETAGRSVIAGVRAPIRRLAVVAVLLTCVAALLAWYIGRRVAQPVARITHAAEGLALGDYAMRVPVTGNYEIARLAESFNRMATQIGDSRSELERRDEELRMVADAIPQLAWMANERGEITWLNERWYEHTGAQRGGSHDALWSEAHERTNLAAVLRQWRSGVQSGRPFEMEVQLRGADGTFQWFLTRAAPVADRDGLISRWFGTSTDVQTLREARDAAEAASRAKSDFLAAMSHELRTPLNAIGGYTELMALGIRGPVSEEQSQDLSRIRASQQHLLTLIGSVLDLSRIESGRVPYVIADVEVEGLLTGLEPLVAPQAAAKNHLLVIEPCAPELVVRADRERLRQILLNLVSNAIRHTPVGTQITVLARRAEAGTVQIIVRDTGLGIAPERHAAVFEPFVQLDRSLTNPAEGIGLGLAISRDLARGMAGDLTIESGPDGGARFTVSLPAADVR